MRQTLGKTKPCITASANQPIKKGKPRRACPFFGKIGLWLWLQPCQRPLPTRKLLRQFVRLGRVFGGQQAFVAQLAKERQTLLTPFAGRLPVRETCGTWRSFIGGQRRVQLTQ